MYRQSDIALHIIAFETEYELHSSENIPAESMVAESSQGTGFLLEKPSARSSADFGEGHRPRQWSSLKFQPPSTRRALLRPRPRWRRGRDTQPNRQLAREEMGVESCEKGARRAAGALRAKPLFFSLWHDKRTKKN